MQVHAMAKLARISSTRQYLHDPLSEQQFSLIVARHPHFFENLWWFSGRNERFSPVDYIARPFETCVQMAKVHHRSLNLEITCLKAFVRRK
jgi:hypothetical protein